MSSSQSITALHVTNQCVVVCDLERWTDAYSPAWEVIAGSQDDIGRSLAAILDSRGIRRIDDFGGVCQTFLCAEEEYVEVPPRTKSGAAVFSFTPKNRLLAEGGEMARVARAAGYKLLIMTVQKHSKFGKVWVLCAALRHLTDRLTYYEDTDSVVDELKASEEGNKVTAIHVQVPGYEECKSQLADRVVTQAEYRREVLE
jgi:hypothetical protein